MNRRDFSGSTLPMALIGAEAVAGAAIMETKRDDDYRPCGFLDPKTAGCDEVDFVTVNGRRVEHVTALNDVEGWVEYLAPVATDEKRIRKYHEKGVVRVHWKAS